MSFRFLLHRARNVVSAARRVAAMIVLSAVTGLAGAQALAQSELAQSAPAPATLLQAAPDIQAIKDRGTLVVAMFQEDRFPFFFENARGDLVGIDVDLAKDIARQLGVSVVFNRNAPTFEDVVGMVVRGEADVAISKVSVTLPRAERVLYTEPYVSLKQGLLVNRVRYAALGRQRGNPLTWISQGSPRREW